MNTWFTVSHDEHKMQVIPTVSLGYEKGTNTFRLFIHIGNVELYCS